MLIHTEKVTAEISIRQPPPRTYPPMKVTKSDITYDNAETKHEPLSIDTNQSNIDINSTTIILDRGQPLVINFEEKYLIDIK
ncbi:unnamed protein product [Rotaria sp. Silwood1]|nr:unnamed protein product [Rotaria sp. Silwood1]CAF0998452.1 unnamed protein product [Rotaria sp. Silwood1]